MNRKKIILHIGDAKTGTSSIQNYLTYNRNILEKNGILYSRIGLLSNSGIAQHKLAFCMNINHQDYNKYTDELYGKLLNEINETKCSTIIISSEGFCSLRTDQEINKLKSYFSDYNVQILVYLRRPDLWIESWYAQIVKNSPFVTKTFYEYLAKHQEPSLSTILGYANIFKDENMIIRSFEKKKMFNGDLIQDLFHSLGLNLIGTDVSNINQTPDIYVTELLRHINKTVELPPRFRIHLNNELVNTLKLSDRKYYFSLKSREAFLKKYDDLISEINIRFFNGDNIFSAPDKSIGVNDESLSSVPKLDDISKILKINSII